MAEVFKAQSVGAEGVAKTLVIKRIRPELATDKRFVELFISEAKLAMELNHPNIVQIYDFGKVDETYYLAMEYIDGVHLGRLLRAAERCDCPMEVGDAVYIAMEVAKGLDYAHRRNDAYGEPLGLVHRDISPQNIMISRDGTVKLLDFGIAQTRAQGRWQEGQELVGKVRYMSPEQARGETLDQRSDLFGLGAVLFEMVCGRPLFVAPSEDETRQLVSSAVVPDLGTVADIPESLEHVLYKALTRDREQRIESAREFQVRLTRVLYEQEEIHDGTTVAEYIVKLDEKIVDNEGGTVLLDGAWDNPDEDQEITVVTGQAATPGISWRETGPTQRQKRRSVEVTRQKKEVTLIHGQVRTHLSGERGERKLEAFAKVVESIAYKHDAIIHRLDGWEFTLLLGIPMATEADATRAARMCLLFKDAVKGLRLTAEGDVQELVSLVVGSEKVLLEEHVEGQERHYEWSLPPEQEEKFRDVARSAGSVIAVDQAIRARIERRFVVRPMAQGNKNETYYQLQGPKSIRSQLKDLRRSFEHFHGRELEQRIMRTRLRSTLLNEQAAAMIWVGDAGVGKSTLMEGFLSDLSGDDVRVVRGVATPAQRDIPLASATALFAEMLGLDLRLEKGELRHQIRQQVDALFGEPPPDQERWIEASLQQLFDTETSSVGSGELNLVSGSSRRQQLFSALRKLTDRLARRCPLVIAIDDVEYIDPVMMHFAAQYFDSPRSAPVFFVGTARKEGEVESRRAWKQLLAARFVRVESLPELSKKSAEELVRGLLSMTGCMVDDEVVDQLVDRSGGNPLYIQEVVEAWQEEGEDNEVETRGLPASIEGLLEARLDRMARELREDLRRLALLPEPFSRAIAQSALQIDERHLEELTRAGLLRPADREAERFQFESEVIRRSAARGLLDEDRREIHQAIARELLCRRERYDSKVVAHHLEGGGQRSEALKWYEEAIEEAYTDWGSAHCLQLCEEVLARPWLDDGERGRILKWKAAALRELGATEERRKTLEQWSRVAAQTSDLDQRLEVMVEEVRFLRGEGELERARGRVEVLREQAREGGKRRFEARAWRLEAVIDLSEGRRDRALTLIDRAIASLHQIGEGGDQRVLVESYVTRGVILRQSGRHREALESYETALMISQDLRSSTLHRQLLINSGLARAYMGDFSKAKQCYSEALEICRRLGHRRDEALVLVNLGHLYEMLGRVERAVESTRRGIYLAREAEDVHTEIDGIITLGLAHLGQGEWQQAEEYLEEGWQRARALPHVYMMVCALLGRAQLELGRGSQEGIAQAETMAREALNFSEDAGLVWGDVMGRHLMAEVDKARGADEEALAWSSEALKRLEGLELYGEDAVLMGQIELMDHGDARNALIGRAMQLTQHRLQNIDDEADREAYKNRELTRKIIGLAPVAAASE